MSITDKELYNQNQRIMDLKRATYESLYKKCVNLIKLNSKKGELMCFYYIPKIVFGSGYPHVNIEYCAKYIIDKLHIANKHIRATLVQPNMLLIDWRII